LLRPGDILKPFREKLLTFHSCHTYPDTTASCMTELLQRTCWRCPVSQHTVRGLLEGPTADHVRKVRRSYAVYEEFYRRMSFPAPPNFITTQGHSSTVVRGTWEAVKNILVAGVLPRWHKEMMFVAISKDRACVYCTAAHIACCRMLGVKPPRCHGNGSGSDVQYAVT